MTPTRLPVDRPRRTGAQIGDPQTNGKNGHKWPEMVRLASPGTVNARPDRRPVVSFAMIRFLHVIATVLLATQLVASAANAQSERWMTLPPTPALPVPQQAATA